MLRENIPSLQFHIYGDKTPYMSRMMELISALDLEKTVLYHGRKTHPEIAKALAAIDLGADPESTQPLHGGEHANTHLRKPRYG